MDKKNYEYSCEEISSMSLEELIETHRAAISRCDDMEWTFSEIIREWDSFPPFLSALEMEIDRKRPKTRKPKVKKKTFLYLIEDERNGFIKIGRAQSPSARERTLQSEMPLLSLIWQCEGLQQDEKDLHERFKDKRVRGEWFSLSKEDIEFIKSLKWRGDKCL